MGRRIWVTGTDTGVGKTVVTASIAAALRERGLSVRALKPVASGVPAGEWGEDAELLGLGAGHAPLVHTRLETPVSPHRAAIVEGRTIDLDAVAAWIADQRADVVLVEGVGGWRAPLDADGAGLVDLVRRAPGDVIVVAADRLGTLNHTLLTLEAVRADRLSVATVVLNAGVGDPEDASRPWNAEDLRHLAGAPLARAVAVDVRDARALAENGRDAVAHLFGPAAGGKLSAGRRP